MQEAKNTKLEPIFGTTSMQISTMPSILFRALSSNITMLLILDSLILIHLIINHCWSTLLFSCLGIVEDLHIVAI